MDREKERTTDGYKKKARKCSFDRTNDELSEKPSSINLSQEELEFRLCVNVCVCVSVCERETEESNFSS